MSCDVWQCEFCGLRQGLSWGDVTGPSVCPRCKNDPEWVAKKDEKIEKLEIENKQLREKLNPNLEKLEKKEKELLDLRKRIKEYVNHPDGQMSFKTLTGYANEGIRLTVEHTKLEM